MVKEFFLELKTKKKAIVYAVFLHVFVILLLIFSFEHYKTVNSLKDSSNNSDNKIVQAVKIDNKAVETEINKITAKKQQEENAKLQVAKKLQELAAKAKIQRMLEQKKVEELKQKQLLAIKMQTEEKLKAKKELEILSNEKLKQQKELDKMQKLQAAAKQQQEEAARLAKIKALMQEKQKQFMQQQLQAENEQIRKVNKAIINSEIKKYGSLIVAAIEKNWVIPHRIDNNNLPKILINLAEDGKVLRVVLTKSSGDNILDKSVIAAVFKASPLPVPKDANIFKNFATLNLTVSKDWILNTK